MKNERILVLKDIDGYYYFPEQIEGCTFKIIYKNHTYISRVFRKLLLKAKSPMINFFFSHWIKDADKADTIIVFDTGNTVELLDYLREKYASKRIILWYWNPVAKSINPLHIKTEKIEMWSFDIEDCEKYGLKYNTQFYFRENLNRGSDICKEFQEIFYVGKDKNRASLLKKLSTEFQAKGLTYLFYLVKSNRNQKDKDTEYRAALSYPDVLSYILNSKVLLDIVHEEQKGLTLRPLESLIFKRKLITNMLNIDCYPIYNKNNVFILGVDDVSEILDFINGEYDEFYYNELLEYYAFDSWLSRFDMTHENVGEYE